MYTSTNRKTSSFYLCLSLVTLICSVFLPLDAADEVLNYSPIEKKVYDACQSDLSRLMYTLRLSNPYPAESIPHKLWEEQTQLNVPILVLSSVFLDQFCKNNNKHRILFSARGCCHFIDIFKKMFPNYSSIYFLSSRVAYNKASSYYVDYVKSVYSPDSVIVDEQGTGDTCHKFFEKHFSSTPSYLAIVSRSYRPGIVKIPSNAISNIERLNYALDGSLLNFDSQGPIKDYIEYDKQYVLPAFKCIEKCVEILNQYHFESFNQGLINDLVYTLDHTRTTASQYIRHKG